MAWVFERLPLASGMRVLEVGAGPALVWSRNAGRLPPDLTPVLSDFSLGMVAEARRALGGEAERFRYVQADVQAIPFPDDRFDCVLANHMLYHVPDRVAAIAEIARVLRPGGTLLATTLGAGHMRELRDIAWEVTGDTRYSGARAVRGFLLENGPAQLEPRFRDVAIERYPDSLRVTEAEPLVSYLCSMILSAKLDAAQVDALRAWVERAIAERGEILITKDSGLIRARTR